MGLEITQIGHPMCSGTHATTGTVVPSLVQVQECALKGQVRPFFIFHPPHVPFLKVDLRTHLLAGRVCL
jgi:hypothetical protein